MSASSSRHAPPSPVQTPPPVPVQPALKRRRLRDTSYLREARDTSIVDGPAIAAAMDQCFDTLNSVLSCYPNSSTVVAQHEWSTFVWNSRLPQWAQTNLVNLYLFHADSGLPVLNFTDVPNPTAEAGFKHVQVDDLWWGSRGDQWNGENISFPFYWIITRNDRSIANSDLPQATFTAVQTTFADSIIASMTSAAAASSASAASASAASVSAASVSAASASAASLSSLSHLSSGVPASAGSGVNGPTPTGAVQDSNNGAASFPKWAIAVIVVLGFLALVASGVLAFYLVRRFRQQRTGTLSHRNSMGSSTPMMSHAERGMPTSPVMDSAALAGGVGAAAGYGASAQGDRPASPGAGYDGASMISRTSDTGLFSGADAAIIANAFRRALRNPDHADAPIEEGESPDDLAARSRAELLNQELAEEGRDIRSVGSSRGVRVETLSDDGTDAATVQDTH